MVYCSRKVDFIGLNGTRMTKNKTAQHINNRNIQRGQSN